MRIEKLLPSTLNAAQRVVYEAITTGARGRGTQHFSLVDENGALNGPFGLMLHAPAIGLQLQELGTAIRFHSSLSERVREIAILQVATATQSEFEWWAHKKIARAIGLSQQELDDIAAGTFKCQDEHEQAAYDAVALLLTSQSIPDDAYSRLAAVLDTRTLVDKPRNTKHLGSGRRSDRSPSVLKRISVRGVRGSTRTPSRRPLRRATERPE